MEGQFTVSAPIEAKSEATVVTSITINDAMGKMSGMTSGRFADKIMRLESKSIPMQTSHGGNPQMIRVGVELHGMEDPTLDPFYQGPWDIRAGVCIAFSLSINML